MSSKKKILEDMFDHGFATREVELIPEKNFTIKFRNIEMDAQFDLEERLSEMKDTSVRLGTQKYALYLLARTLLKWGDFTAHNWAEWEQFLEKQSVIFLDIAVKKQQQFEKDIKEALGVEEVKENFSHLDEQPEDSEPSPRESMKKRSENEEA